AGRVGAFAAGLEAAVRAGGLSAAAPAVGPLMGLYVGPPGEEVAPPADYEGARRLAENGVHKAFFHGLLRRGVVIAPGPYEVLFCGLAHGDEELSFALEAAGDAATEVAANRSSVVG
ncbi:MAG: hypothetical protein ACRDWE_05480, partial [Acidimicrobiales bacterium]